MDKIEHQGLKISLYGAFLLAVLGISFSFITGSQAVLLDGIFNCISVLTAWLAIKISKAMVEPFSERMPAGYVAFEPFYIIVKGLIVFGLSVTVMITSIFTLLSGGNELKLGIIIIYIIIASVVNVLIYLIVKAKSLKSNSPMLTVEKENWLINMLVTLGIASAFILVILLKDSILKPITVYIDQIIVIIVVLISISVPLKAIRNGFRELMLYGADQYLYDKIGQLTHETLAAIPEANKKMFLLKTGRKYWISLFIKPSTSTIKTEFSDEIKSQIVKDIQNEFPINNVDVIITNNI